MEGAPTLDMNLDTLAAKATIADIVYVPLETDLLARAKACGRTPVDGLGMLVHQAAHAFDCGSAGARLLTARCAIA